VFFICVLQSNMAYWHPDLSSTPFGFCQDNMNRRYFSRETPWKGKLYKITHNRTGGTLYGEISADCLSQLFLKKKPAAIRRLSILFVLIYISCMMKQQHNWDMKLVFMYSFPPTPITLFFSSLASGTSGSSHKVLSARKING